MEYSVPAIGACLLYSHEDRAVPLQRRVPDYKGRVCIRTLRVMLHSRPHLSRLARDSVHEIPVPTGYGITPLGLQYQNVAKVPDPEKLVTMGQRDLEGADPKLLRRRARVATLPMSRLSRYGRSKRWRRDSARPRRRE